MTEFDGNLDDRIIQGDKKAFDELFRLFYSRLLGFANAYLKDKSVAENMVQDAFLQLWERKEVLQAGSNIRAWLLTVVRNHTINHINRKKRQLEAETTYATNAVRELNLRISSLKACDPEYIYGTEMEHILEKALEALPEQSRKIIIMSRFEDMTHKDIAQKMGITVKGVEYHITKSLKILRSELKDYLTFLIFFA